MAQPAAVESDRLPQDSFFQGRIYDPQMGRFLSPDAVVQFPADFQSYNRYSYVRNNPLTNKDATGFYEEAGHFYTTFMVARAVGMSKERAFRLAYYSQYPDERRATTAYANPRDFLMRMARRESRTELRNVQETIHSLHGGSGEEVNRVRTGLQDAVADGNVNDETRGIVIHALGDSYAHTRRVEARDASGVVTGTEEQAYGSPLGHGAQRQPNAPDVISNRPELFGEYVTALADALSRVSGEKVNQQQLDGIRKVVTGLPPGGNDGRADTAALRGLAQNEFGYVDPYAPETSPEATSERLPDLTQEQVNATMEEIRNRIRNRNHP